MIHFFPAANAKMRSKVPAIAPTVDILLANLEDGVPADQKDEARAGLVEVASTTEFGDTQFWWARYQLGVVLVRNGSYDQARGISKRCGTIRIFELTP